MKEQIQVPKPEQSNEEIANLSDGEFKTLVIRLFPSRGKSEGYAK